MEEVGVWVVYNLEANKKIQKLLLDEGFTFMFAPNLKIANQKVSGTTERS